MNISRRGFGAMALSTLAVGVTPASSPSRVIKQKFDAGELMA